MELPPETRLQKILRQQAEHREQFLFEMLNELRDDFSDTEMTNIIYEFKTLESHYEATTRRLRRPESIHRVTVTFASYLAETMRFIENQFAAEKEDPSE